MARYLHDNSIFTYTTITTMSEQLFKWLMGLVVMVCVPWLLESCRNLRKTDYRHSEEYLKERVEKIYANVALFYNRLYELRQSGQGCPTQWPDFDSLYCSDDWNRHVAAVTELDDERGMETGFFGWNYWVCGEDFDFVYASDVEVIDKTGMQATVALAMHNGERVVPVLLNMVYERGDWRIDEMTSNWNHHAYGSYEWKLEMENYISHNSDASSLRG